MRKVIVTKKNEDSFEWTHDSPIDLLRTIDELLHNKDLEIIIGENSEGNRYFLKINKCRVDEEYDADRTRSILEGDMFNWL